MRQIIRAPRVLVATFTLAGLTLLSVAQVQPSSADAIATGGPAQQALSTGAVPLTEETFANPPKEVRPGTRWWWDLLLSESEFKLKDALDEIDAFAEAGFGRFEIAWAVSTYGTKEQREILRAVAEHAQKRGLQLDMTLGETWPWTAPPATGDKGHQELMYGRTDVSGPSTFSGEVPPAIGDEEPRGKLTAVTAAKVITPGPAVTEADSPPESSTILDPDSLIDLTSRVSGTSLTWEVPAGDWIIFSFWQRTPETCGAFTGKATNCVSLIDEDSVRAGLNYVDSNQVGEAEAAVSKTGHSFFEDSLEFEVEELHWSTDFPAEFAGRRGYDMTKYLPLMFVQTVSDNPVPEKEPVPDFELPDDEGARYRHDYYETLTDLYIDEHIEVVADWATKYGMRYRSQAAYGNPFEVIRSARDAARAGALVDDESLGAGDVGDAEVSYLDTDGTQYDKPDSPKWRRAMDHYRVVTSGSHQGGGLEVSTELGATFSHELHTFLRGYKRMMDKEWAAGISRPLLHGVTHSPEGTPWPGASHFGGFVGESLNHRTWPEWTHFKPLSDYWARGALVLHQGAARTDVAVLRDSFMGNVSFAGLELEKAGFTIGYADPIGVAQTSTGPHGELFPDGPSYDVLVVDTSQFYVGPGRLPADAAEAINAASAKGLKVVFVGELPKRGLSGKDAAAEDVRVRQAVAATLTRDTSVHVRSQDDVAQAVKELGARPAAEWLAPSRVYTQLRETQNAQYYLLWNATDQRQKFTGSFAATGAPTELDLWAGKFRPAALYRGQNGRVNVPLNLAPHETTVLMFPKAERRTHVTSTTADDVVTAGADAVEVRDAQGGPQKVQLSNGATRTADLPTVTDPAITVGSWQLQVTTDGPEGKVERPAIPLATLADWRTLPGLTTESGIGTYIAEITLPASWTAPSRGARLDLGAFEGSVQVSVNGTLVTPDIDPQEPMDVTHLLAPGKNTIRVVLATTPFNKAVASPTTVATRPVWASPTYGTQAYGLLGEVRLLPDARTEVNLARRPDLTVTNLEATQDKPKQTQLGVTVANRGDADADGVVVEFRDGDAVLGRTAPVTLPHGASAPVTFTWDTRAVKGEHRITAVVDPDNAVTESDEANNSASRTVTIRGNKVSNGSFESTTDGTQPEGWTGTGSAASYDTSGELASDGKAAVVVAGTGAPINGARWTSQPIDVVPGKDYDLAMTVAASDASSSPGLAVSYLDSAGTVLDTVPGITTTLTGDAAARQVTGRVTIPAGATRLRLTLTGFAPTDVTPAGTAWFDDLWMW